MEKIKLIYNPVAGTRSFPDNLDKFIALFQEKYRISVYRTEKEKSIDNGLQDVEAGQYSALIVVGGDGTINKIVNYMLSRNIDIPLGIIPAGTVNDFAHHLQLPFSYEDCFRTLLRGKTRRIDTARVNDQYFINVCAGGLLATVAHNTNVQLKSKMGRLAYYINGLREVASLEPVSLRITAGERVIEEDSYMFIILNSTRAGGFTNLALEAKIDDGLLDLILIKSSGLHKLPNLLFEFFNNRHLDHEDVLFIQNESFRIELADNCDKSLQTDLDGELGPELPLEISVIPESLTVFTG
ncbi:MAG: diacylglycerol/lipid kinase family protein [Halanaerobiales bacterium]